MADATKETAAPRRAHDDPPWVRATLILTAVAVMAFFVLVRGSAGLS